jgi:hypothetical protein
MKIAFTLCSNNYLAHAKTLYDSFVRHNPDYTFFIGLVDEVSNSISLVDRETLIPVKEVLPVDLLEEMAARYNIIEFNTAVKPFYLQYFIEKFPALEYLIYLDPDIIVHGSFQEVEKELGEQNILITPHITQPYGVDSHLLSEMTFLSYGIFNLGFIGLRNFKETILFVKWWQERLRTLCVIDFGEGLFTDQKWINYAPVFFDKVKVSYHLGLNAAYWNLHERQIKKVGNAYWVNERFPLVFYHISGFDPLKPSQISKVQTRIDIAKRTDDVLQVYRQYASSLISNGCLLLAKYPYAYGIHYELGKRKALQEYLDSNKNNKLFYYLYKLLPNVVHKLVNAYMERVRFFKKHS